MAPVLIVVDQKNLGVVYGIDYDRFAGLSKGFTFLSGGPFHQPDQAIADDLAAQSRKLRVGQKTILLGHEFTISGIVLHGKGARFFIPIKTAQDIAGADGRASMFYVRSKGDTEGARNELVKLLPTYKIRSMAEYSTLMSSSNLPELKPFIRSFVMLGVAISFLVVLLTMHTMVFERTRDIGVLRALGSSRLEVCWMILGETLVMVGAGRDLRIALHVQRRRDFAQDLAHASNCHRGRMDRPRDPADDWRRDCRRDVSRSARGAK